MRWRGKFFELCVYCSNSFNIGVLDELQVSFLIFCSSLLDFLLKKSIMIFDFIFVKSNETLRNKTPIGESASYFKQVLEQDHEKHILLLWRQ